MPNEMMTQPFRVTNDVQDQLFSQGLSYTNFVGVANRINQTNLYLSFENNSNEGVLVETGGYNRQSFRMNIDHAINDKMKISASNSYISTSNDMASSESSTFFNALMMDPDVDLLRDNENGDPYNFLPNHWNTIVHNPIYDLWARENLSKKNRFMGNYQFNWAVFDWMSFKASYSIENENYDRKSYTPKDSFNAFSNDDIVGSIGYLERKLSKTFNQSYRATLSFNKSWGIVDFNGKISYLGEDNYLQTNSLNGNTFELSNYPSFSVIDETNERLSEYVYQDKAENLFAIASFVIKDRYIFDGLVRRDISSLFGSEQRTNNYYRVSGAYRISQDIDIPGVQELKVRGALGTAGQRPGFSYQYETYTRSNGQYLKNTLGNVDLKPSNSKEIELGIDISFLDRFTSELTYSETNTDEQFILVPLLSHQGGYKYQWQNAASLQSNTFEAM
ncbi:MAG: TonB-dependent receptor, partial [Chlamydiia bacterium]|nr:TonB-dependent receptor [Chlamydiia bacterium]